MIGISWIKIVLILLLGAPSAAQQTSGNANSRLDGNVLYANRFNGVDILAQASTAFSACGWMCTVVIPPTSNRLSYTASSTLAIPLKNLSGPTLVMTGACIHYTGSGYAVDTYEVQPNPSSVRIKIVDGCFDGTAAGLGGLRLLPTSDITVSGTRIVNFTRGDAVAIYGTEDVNILGNYSFANNRYGVRIQGTFCRQGLPFVNGAPDYSCTDTFSTKGCDGLTFQAHDGVCGYAGNMIHVQNGALSNLEWDVYEEGPPGLEHLSNSYQNNELNGGGGGIFLEMSRGDKIGSNYFESKKGKFIVLGNAAVQPQYYISTATAIESNYFTTNGGSAITVENGDHISVVNNAELLGNRTACFLDSVEIRQTYFANNKVASVNSLCRRGRPNADATDAVMAHFSGDPADGYSLQFNFREGQYGDVYMSGPELAPKGPCTGSGQWMHSKDGHISVCLGGIWVQKL